MTVNEFIQYLQNNYKGDQTLFVQWFDASHANLSEKKWAKLVKKLDYLQDEISTLVHEAIEENT